MLNLRTRFGIPGILSVIALVFAMTGGAFAAKYVITSTKQIKPKVLKQLKGKTGPEGPQGPAGANGTNGTNGKDGATGATGTNGTNGKSVLATPIPGEPGEECEGVEGTEFEVEESGVQTFACNGAEGAEGPAGPITGVLPSGVTLTGTWGVATAAEDFEMLQISYGLSLPSAPTMHYLREGNRSAKGKGNLTSGSTSVTSLTISCLGCFGKWEVGSPISGTNIPAGATITACTPAPPPGSNVCGTPTTGLTLSAAATGTATGVALTAGLPTACTGGTAAEPKANPGHLCIYTATEELEVGQVLGPISSAPKTGAVARLLVEFGSVWGSWAVTAP